MGREPRGASRPGIDAEIDPKTGTETGTEAGADPVAALRALVGIPTVSWPDEGHVDAAAFEALHAELADRFPLLHSRLEQHRVGVHGLMFRWRGAATDRPVVLMAHQDVVPVDDSAPWQHPPF